MKAYLALISLVLFTTVSFAQIEERNVDFTISPAILLEDKIHIAFEWLTPSEFRKKNLGLADLPKISELSPENNQMIAAKIAFLSQKSFDELSAAKMNNMNFISQMLNSVGISKKSTDVWRITNKVKAYGLPFKVSFDFNVKESSSSTLGIQAANYLKDEGAGLKGSGRERFLILDMTNFSQLIYRNYAVIYIKEMASKETMIVAAIISGLDLRAANSFFNIPPFSTTKSTMMGNFKTQIYNMAGSIQK